jgi:deoxyribose-phosphate aldolase
LNEGETERDIDRLCERAVTPFGAVAAVCIWPKWVARVRARLPGSVAVAAVANFPQGDIDTPTVLHDIRQIADAGGQEVDVVLPWRALLAGQSAACATWLRAVRRESEGLRLKLIIESGELVEPGLVAEACRLGLGEGVDFLKTSTGKTAIGATLAAAEVMLRTMAQDPRAAHTVGFKASGGVRTVAEAAEYMDLVGQHLGSAALVPARFRIGASSLLADIETVLNPSAKPPANSAAGY